MKQHATSCDSMVSHIGLEFSAFTDYIKVTSRKGLAGLFSVKALAGLNHFSGRLPAATARLANTGWEGSTNISVDDNLTALRTDGCRSDFDILELARNGVQFANRP